MVDIGGGIDPASNALALALASEVRGATEAGWGDPVPAYDSVLVPFDPERLDPQDAARRLEAMLDGLQRQSAGRRRWSAAPHPGPLRRRPWPRPRGGRRAARPDAGAGRRGARGGQRIGSSCSASHPASPTSVHCRRRCACRAASSPGRGCPSASVAIAGSQTAVYPVATPGGWHLIGRTDVSVWDARRAEPALLLPGDAVRFEPVVD